jgi:hypothetical protein
MLRVVVALALMGAACTPAQAPHARKAGAGLALGGVAGLIASAATVHVNTHTEEFLIGFSVVTVFGMGMFAAGDLAEPAALQETLPERHHRWAKILTERAQGAAREGRCPRVRRLETKVRGYDREVHDFVFMRDPEILKCMSADVTPPPPPEPEPEPEPADDALPDAAAPAPGLPPPPSP